MVALAVEEHKAVILRAYEEIWNRRDWSVAKEILADDLVVHTPTHPEPLRGPDGFKELWSELHTAYPDFHISVDDILGEGDKVATRFTMTGTNTGPHMGMPPTGRLVTIKEFAVYHFRGGRINEAWFMMDTTSVGRQLGMIPDGPPPMLLLKVMGAMGKLADLLPKRIAKA